MPSSVPVIDLHPWYTGGPDERAVAAEVDVALRTVGFFLVTGHGVPQSQRDRVRQLCREFFSLPESVKRANTVTVGGRGWLPSGVEANGYSEGTETHLT